jgi:hypothetical protein
MTNHSVVDAIEVMKPVYFSLGWFFFALGALGVLLPVLPTTPFMILALWAFSKSSERFHRWLYNHKFFGPPLQLWDRYRVIPMVAKVFSVTVMLVSFLYLLMFTDTNVWVLAAVAALMLYGAIYILSKPSRAPEYSKAP